MGTQLNDESGAAGGTTHVPVYCDGTNWLIG